MTIIDSKIKLFGRFNVPALTNAYIRFVIEGPNNHSNLILSAKGSLYHPSLVSAPFMSLDFQDLFDNHLEETEESSGNSRGSKDNDE